MNRLTKKKAVWLSVAFALLFSWTSTESFGQPVYSKPTSPAPTPKPLLQDIKIYQENSPSENASKPLVKSTSDVKPASTAVAAPARIMNTAYPALANVVVPGYTGILVETLDGKPVMESYSNLAFNPASNVKVATAYAVLKTFGPDFRFQTQVWTDGAYEQATGTIHGNLYVSGRDPVFNYEHGVALASELNRMGIRVVTGDLVVSDNFTMNHNGSAPRSGASLMATMDGGKRPTAAVKAWQTYLANAGKGGLTFPSVTFSGAVYVQPMPSNVKLLFNHESTPLREIVKATMCYSNNFLSERLGDMVGGAYAVARIVQVNAGVSPQEFYLQTASGLGINRVTPRAQMKLLRAFRKELERYRMTFADVMPVAGIDKGTLAHRFDEDFSTGSVAGSVVGKTGTLGNTDAGVSTLTGEIHTKQGKLLFVIFNQRGSVSRFRGFQNSYVSLIQAQFGGAAQMAYTPVGLDIRLAKSRFTYPNANFGLNE